jgi:hypothetical protein
MSKAILYWTLILLCITCKNKNKDNINPEPIDNVPVSITINLALPAYFHMQNVGSYVYETGGVKGVVLVHHTDDNYYAFDRACSYQPKSSPCSKLEVDPGVMQFRCGETTSQGFQKCCDSRFFFDGSVSQSPARFPLKQYNVSKSGNTIIISN